MTVEKYYMKRLCVAIIQLTFRSQLEVGMFFCGLFVPRSSNAWMQCQERLFLTACDTHAYDAFDPYDAFNVYDVFEIIVSWLRWIWCSQYIWNQFLMIHLRSVLIHLRWCIWDDAFEIMHLRSSCLWCIWYQFWCLQCIWCLKLLPNALDFLLYNARHSCIVKCRERLATFYSEVERVLLCIVKFDQSQIFERCRVLSRAFGHPTIQSRAHAHAVSAVFCHWLVFSCQ